MTEIEALRAVSDQYRKEGYLVADESQTELVPFLEISDIDLIATKGDEVLAIEVNRQDDQTIRRVTMAAGRIDADYSLSLLEEAEKLLTPDTRLAALLMAWTAFEAAAREVLRVGDHLERRSPAVMIQELFRWGYFDAAEVEKLRQGMYARNLLVHGVEPTQIDQETIGSLLDAVKRIKFGGPPGQIRSHSAASVSIVRAAVNQDPTIRVWVEKAVGLLDEVLGSSRSEVSVDWNRGDDGQGGSVVILRLSDLTGTVSGSFALDEMENPSRLKTRFYKIWGDLLRIRVNHLLGNLNGMRGSA